MGFDFGPKLAHAISLTSAAKWIIVISPIQATSWQRGAGEKYPPKIHQKSSSKSGGKKWSVIDNPATVFSEIIDWILRENDGA